MFTLTFTSIKSQTIDTSAFTVMYGGTDVWGVGYSDTSASVFVSKDGRIYVTGDSLQVIRLLLKRLDESSQRELEAWDRQELLWQFVNKAIAFTNNVPDYWKESKNNKAWPKYYAILKELGYRIVRK
jgi:hypothetical protein